MQRETSFGIPIAQGIRDEASSSTRDLLRGSKMATIDMPFLVSESKTLGFSSLTRRKHSNAQKQAKGAPQLAKHLRVAQLVAIGIGSTIGAGVYVLVGTVARDRAGPSLSASFLIAGIAAALSALCYAELSSRCPSAGSAYHYAYTCVGEGIAWIIGWALILEYTVGGAAVARGISPNLAIFFGGSDNLPSWLARRAIPGTSIVCDPCALLLVVFVTGLLSSGIKESVMVQSVMTLLNCSVLLFVVLAGMWVGFQTGWPGYKVEGGYLPFGFSGMLSGAATVFFSYIGFDTVASTAEEVKNPQRDLPLGIGLSLSICSSLYMAVSAIVVGIVPYQSIDPDTPMSSAFSENGMPWAMYIVAGGAVAALSTTLLGSLLPQPRILLAMARDGLLPPFFSKLHTTTSVPVGSTLVTGIAAGLMAFLMNVDELSGMVSVGTLMAFTIVGISILVLRYVPPKETMVISAGPASGTKAVPYATKKDPVVVQTKEEYCSPVLSIFSETSMPAADDEDDVSSVSSSSSCNDLPLLMEGNNSQEEQELQVEVKNMSLKGKDVLRRKHAYLAISGVCIGVLLVSLATSLSLFPSWAHWCLALVGGAVLATSTIVLLRIDQDEDHHQFGQSGGFHCPGVPLLPIISILINVYLLANLGATTWLRVSLWLVVGIIVYSFYGVHHSLLGKLPDSIYS